jgi:hypothetical protein
LRAGLLGSLLQGCSLSGVGWLLPDTTLLPNLQIKGWRLDMRQHLQLKRRAIASHAAQYSVLIDDDPSGFRLPPELRSIFDAPHEVLLSTL